MKQQHMYAIPIESTDKILWVKEIRMYRYEQRAKVHKRYDT